MQLQTYVESGIQRDFTTTVARNYLDAEPVDPEGASFSSGSLKGTAVAALAFLPTIIQSVFTPPLDTMILPEGMSHRPAFVQNYQKAGESIASVALASVLEGYVVHSLEPVEKYLADNCDLLGFLAGVSSKLKEVNSIESFELEYYYDFEEGWDKLFVVANTQLEDTDELDKLEATLFDSLFEPQTLLLSGRVILSIG